MVMSEKGFHPNRLSSRSDGGARPGLVSSKPPDLHREAVAGRPPLFSGISADDYAAISAAARAKEFTRGEVLYLEGDAVEQILLLTSGSVKTTRLGLSGVEVILRLWVPGDVLGPADLLAGGRHSSTAQAFRLTRALVWDATSFKALAGRYPVLDQNLLRMVVRYLADLEERFRELATERVAPRVARQLVRLLPQIGRPVNGAIEVSLSREELAQMTGTTLFTVSRLLSAWEARGWVKPRRKAVTICDVRALSAIAKETRKGAKPIDGQGGGRLP
jgi:CRP-like cAMP-binding protein